MKQTVLAVVEDSAVRAAIKFSLEIEGFVVRAFANSDELLAGDPLPVTACLLLDNASPRVNGIAMAAALRERGICFPTILIATDPSNAIRAQASTMGITLIEKPLLGNELAETIWFTLGGN